MAKEKRQKFTTPRGKAVYPHLNTPDTKFNAAGVYTVKLAVKSKLAEELVAKIDAAHKEAEKEGKEAWKEACEAAKKNRKPAPKYEEGPLPYFVDEEADETVFSFKMNASYKKDGKVIPLKPGIFSASGKPCNPRIGGGTVMRVSFEMNKYWSTVSGWGVSLRLSGVQIFELVEWTGGGNAAAHGFEAEEGGFEPSEETEEQSDASSESSSESSDSGDVDAAEF